MTTATILALTIIPESVLHTDWYLALSGFVAINTILYVTLSIFKIMPKLYLNDVIEHHGRRAETRSIFPNGHSAPADHRPAPGSLAAIHDARAETTRRGATASSDHAPGPSGSGSDTATSRR